MKQAIEGKLYDTEAAKYIATARPQLSKDDPGYWEETLYRKSTGEFFTHDKGFINKGDSHKIKSLSEKQAFCWAEDNCVEDEFESNVGISVCEYSMRGVKEIIIKNKRKELEGFTTEHLRGYVEAMQETLKRRAFTEYEKIMILAAKQEIQERK